MRATTQEGRARFVEAGGLRHHYLEWGAPGSPPAVLLHGLTGNAHHFGALARHLAPGYHVLAIDARGRGDSDWARDGAYTTEAYVADLEGVRRALGLPRISLIGTSMGGRNALAYAGAYPERVQRLVINDIGPEIDPRGAERIFRYVAAAPQRFPSFDELVAWHRLNYPQLSGLSDQELGVYAGHSVKPHPEGGLTWKMDPAVRVAISRPAPEDAWAWARRIVAPALVIRGADSDVLSPEVARRMVAEMKSCRLVEVPGIGHAPSLAEPQALNAIKGMFGLA